MKILISENWRVVSSCTGRLPLHQLTVTGITLCNPVRHPGAPLLIVAEDVTAYMHLDEAIPSLQPSSAHRTAIAHLEAQAAVDRVRLGRIQSTNQVFKQK